MLPITTHLPPVRDIALLAKYLTTPSTKRKPLESKIEKILTHTQKQPDEKITRPPTVADKFIDMVKKITYALVVGKPVKKETEDKTRISKISEQDVIEEFTRRALTRELDYIDTPSLISPLGHEKNNWREFRALMLAFMYSNTDSLDTLQNKITSLTRNDGLPFPIDTPEYNQSFETILRDWEKIDDLFKGFNHLALATKTDGISEFSMFERFIRHSNNKENYTVYKPSGSYENFPGAGFTIHGLHSRVNRFLERELWQGIKQSDNPFYIAAKHYREALVTGEEHLKNSTFLFFRGLIAIFNEKQMAIDGEPHALIIFNEHFRNDTLRMAYLLPQTKVESFLEDPYRTVNEQNILYPSKIEDKFIEIAIDPTSITVLSGYDKAFPLGSNHYSHVQLYDKSGELVTRPLFEHEITYEGEETCDVRNKIHRTHMFGGYWDTIDLRNLSPFASAHKEVAKCLEFGLSQIDLFLDGFRLFNMGFTYNEENKAWSFKPQRLLNQAQNWHQSLKIKENALRPILMPVPRLTYSQFSPELVRGGILDTSNMHYHRLTSEGPIEVNEPSEIKKLWKQYVIRMYNNNADLTFAQGEEIRESVFDILKEKAKGEQ